MPDFLRIGAEVMIAVAAMLTVLWRFNDSLGKELRADIRVLGTELRGDISTLGTELRGEIGALDTRLRGDIGALDGKLSGDIGALDTRFCGEIGTLGTELRGDISALRVDNRELLARVSRIEGLLELRAEPRTKVGATQSSSGSSPADDRDDPKEDADNAVAGG